MATNTKRARMRSQAVCEYLGGQSIRTLDEWAHKGTGPPYSKVGKHRLYDPDEIDAWLEQHKVRGNAA